MIAELTLLLNLYGEPYSPHDQREILCLTEAVWHEARGEGLLGKVMVSHVIRNRVESKRFPNSYCGVVYQKKQFSYTHDGLSDEVVPADVNESRVLTNALNIALATYFNQIEDLTDGSLYYYNPYKAQPYWRNAYEEVATVGNHLFLKPKRNDFN